MKKSGIFSFIIFFSLFIACSKDDDNQSTAKEITSFLFLESDNTALPEDVKGTIDEKEKTIKATVPFGIAITDLQPTIEVSENAKITPGNKTKTDFRETVIYTVTAEDGSKDEYRVTITVASPKNDQEVLIVLYNANPDNTLGWDLEDENLENWEGVALTDGRVTQLAIQNKDIKVLPPSIKYLTQLKFLYLGSNEISSLPAEIGSFVNLEELSLNNLPFTSLPKEIGNLSNLKELKLFNTSLTEVAPELGNLSNLEFLDLGSSSFTSIPGELGKLKKLKRLYLHNGKLESIPAEIGNLTSLRFLILYVNNLTELPEELGQLANLTHLYIYSNKITTIPKSICDLKLSDFRRGEAVCEN